MPSTASSSVAIKKKKIRTQILYPTWYTYQCLLSNIALVYDLEI